MVDVHSKRLAGYDVSSNSLLHLAAKSKSIETLQWLLHQEKLDVNGRNEREDTPLHILAKHVPPSYDTGLLCFILKFGADASLTNQDGATALHYSAATGKHQWCKLLLKQAGVQIDQCDNRGETPIHYATRYVKHRVVGLLIEQSADVTVSGFEGTPLDVLLARRAAKNAHNL